MVALVFAITVCNKCVMNSVHILQSYFFKPHFNIIMSSVRAVPSVTFAPGFQTKTLYAYVIPSMAACLILLPNIYAQPSGLLTLNAVQ